MDFALTIDIGTTRIKYACVSATGVIMCEVSHLIPYSSDTHESDIQEWFRMLTQSIADNIPADIRACICAITIVGQGPSLIPIDKDNQVLTPLLFRKDVDFRISHAHSPSQYIPFALSYLQRDNALAAHVKYWSGIPEYIIYLFCGEWVSMLPTARYRPYFWTPAALRRHALSPAQFPRHVYNGTVIAPLSPHIAKQIGIEAEVPIVSGGLDFYAAIIGARCMHRNAICSRAGSTDGINIVGHPPSQYANHRLLQRYPLFQRLTNTSLIILNSGALLTNTRPDTFAALRRLLLATETGADISLPTIPQKGIALISDPAPDTHARRIQMHHSALIKIETLLFTMRYFLELCADTHTQEHSIALCGGQSSITEWNRLKADFLGVECHSFQCAHTELLGGATIAFTANGTYRTLREATRHISHLTNIYHPSQSLSPQFKHSPRYLAFTHAMEGHISRT